MSWFKKNNKQFAPEQATIQELQLNGLPPKHLRKLWLQAQDVKDFRDAIFNIAPPDLDYRQMSISDGWISNTPHGSTLAGMIQRLHGRTVLDLGFGPELRPFHRLLTAAPPARYIAVDNTIQLPVGQRVRHLPVGDIVSQAADESQPTEMHYMHADMLGSVSLLPNASVNFVINGIDTTILRTTNEVTGQEVPFLKEYNDTLLAEIARTTEIGGVIIGCTYNKGILADLPSYGDFQTKHVSVKEPKMRPLDFYMHERQS